MIAYEVLGMFGHEKTNGSFGAYFIGLLRSRFLS